MPMPEPQPDDIGYVRKGQWCLCMRADGTWEASDRFPVRWVNYLNQMSQRTHADLWKEVRDMLMTIYDELTDE